MRECWLKPNRRALAAGLVGPAVIALVGFLLVLLGPRTGGLVVLLWMGWGLVALGVVLAAGLLYSMRQPRLAYEDGHLLVNLSRAGPERVPIDVVECFFLGQAQVPLPSPAGTPSRAAAVVIRLAESARQWHQRDVLARLGSWTDGYITINGAWCEPLNSAVLHRLNQRLIEIRRQRRQGAEERQ